MKKRLFTALLVLALCPSVFSAENTTTSTQPIKVYKTENKFGLKSGDVEITKAEYTKLIKLGENAFIVQKRNRYGLINKEGKILVPIKYRWADRVASNLVKLGNDFNFGIYDDNGNAILKPEYMTIERISKDCFLTCKNFKYGLVTLNGQVILQNKFDSIFIPDEKTLVIQYKGEWYELDILERANVNLDKEKDSKNSIGEVIVRTSAISGYSVVTFTDYILKLFSSISPAYEATIDELMFSKGADAVPVIMKFSWLPKMPFTLLKNYYKNIRYKDNEILTPAKNYFEKRI